MLQLTTYNLQTLSEVVIDEPLVIRLTTNLNYPVPLRSSEALLVKEYGKGCLPDGFKAYFIANKLSYHYSFEGKTDVYLLPESMDYLQNEDIVRLNPHSKSLHSLYRRNSGQNSLLVTERCNNYCLMCSQPPKQIDDSYLVDELLRAIPLMSRETKEIGITGGEPTLLGKDLLTLMQTIKNYLPNTALHILSNGRNFRDLGLSLSVANVKHPDLMIGIPLYSDIANLHDYVVQAEGAFDETIKGILNLKRCGVKVEIRVVLHKQTVERLPDLAHFITRNLLFVDHVALMGLEMMGFTKANLDDLWIDPVDYQRKLVEAVQILDRFKVNTSIYNLQLCLLDQKLWPFSRKSISDWKNEYMPECEPCLQKSKCAGFFSSAHLKYSGFIKAFTEPETTHSAPEFSTLITS